MTDNLPQFSLTIKNYRCFSDQQPATIAMRPGFTSFVGVNNSGKSSLLKFFYELRDLFVRASPGNDGFRQSLLPDGQQGFNMTGIRDWEEVFCNTNDRDLVIEVAVQRGSFQTTNDGLVPDKITFHVPRSNTQYKTQIWHKSRNMMKGASGIARLNPPHVKIDETLVNLAPYYDVFHSLSNTAYIGPFRNAVNIGGSSNYYDMVIGQQFISFWDGSKSGISKKSTNATLKLTQDVMSIFGFKNLEVNASSDNQNLQVIIDGKSYRLDELGSGLAQFIVILANIAAKRPAWLLIDEPELNLHPSLQMDFLTTLASYASDGILFATHNVGLARACSDTIYSLRCDKSKQDQIEVRDFESTRGLSEFLGELSYSSYHDLGYDKVLLVEGPTDIKTIQQFLRKYGKDHQIVLLSLGGSDLINSTSETELAELLRVSTNIYALIDSERDAAESPIASDRSQFKEMCDKLGMKCKILDRRATENYLSNRAVQAVKGDKYRALAPYEKLKDCPTSWAKQENWRIAREMTCEELKATDLGNFLETL